MPTPVAPKIINVANVIAVIGSLLVKWFSATMCCVYTYSSERYRILGTIITCIQKSWDTLKSSSDKQGVTPIDEQTHLALFAGINHLSLLPGVTFSIILQLQIHAT